MGTGRRRAQLAMTPCRSAPGGVPLPTAATPEYTRGVCRRDDGPKDYFFGPALDD